jgi:23S rRNA (uracil1939-C5)-methyltransferase
VPAVRLSPGETVSLTCLTIDAEGAGLCVLAADVTRAQTASMTVHVPGALPGEGVVAGVTHVSPHRPQAWGALVSVTAPSAERRAPACRAFGACGGCVLQHWDTEAQRAWKTARVVAIFGQHESLGGVVVAPCVASPRALGYRNNAKLVAAQAPDHPLDHPLDRPLDRPLILGAFAPRSHDVVDLRGCRIVEPPLDEVASALRDVLEEAHVSVYDERRLTGDLRYAVLRANADGQVLATLVTARRDWTPGRAVADALRQRCPAVAGVVHNVNPTRGNVIYGDQEHTLAGESALIERIGAVRLRLSSRSFFQANRAVAGLVYQAIASAVAEAARAAPLERLVDVYSGVGGIALTLAPSAREVIGIETHAAAIADAAAAARENGAANVGFVAGDAAGQLRAVDRADVVVLNPPRRGCSPEVLVEVRRLGPRLIAYLSCDPETLARDLAVLVAGGYVVRSVTPFDMLPHTPHIEALAIVDRRIPSP